MEQHWLRSLCTPSRTWCWRKQQHAVSQNKWKNHEKQPRGSHLRVVFHIINHKTLLEWLVWQIIMGLTSTGFGRRVEHDALRRALDIHRTARSCKSRAIKIAIVCPSHGTWMPWFPLVHLVDNYNLQDASWSVGKSLKGWGKYIRMPVRH